MVHESLTGPVKAWLSKTCLCHGQQPKEAIWQPIAHLQPEQSDTT